MYEEDKFILKGIDDREDYGFGTKDIVCKIDKLESKLIKNDIVKDNTKSDKTWEFSDVIKNYKRSEGYRLRNLVNMLPQIADKIREMRLVNESNSKNVVGLDKDTVMFRSINLIKKCYVEVISEYNVSEKSYITSMKVLQVTTDVMCSCELYRTNNINQIKADYINAINVLSSFQKIK